MPDIRMAVWFFFFWEKQHQKLEYHFFFLFLGKPKSEISIPCFPCQGKATRMPICFFFPWKSNWYISPHRPTEGGGGGILLSRLVTVIAMLPSHPHPPLPLMIINQVLSDCYSSTCKNSLLGRKTKTGILICDVGIEWFLMLLFPEKEKLNCHILIPGIAIATEMKQEILSKECYYFTKN